MDDSADVVQQVLAAAAEENGEFELPLKAERIEAMRAALVERRQLVGRLAPRALAQASCTSVAACARPNISKCLGCRMEFVCVRWCRGKRSNSHGVCTYTRIYAGLESTFDTKLTRL